MKANKLFTFLSAALIFVGANMPALALPDNTHEHSYSNGFCTQSGATTSEEGYYETPSGSGTSSDPYLIDNAGKLWWFANYVNGLSTGKHAVYAKLTANINMEGSSRGSFPCIGVYGGSVYSGTFDGQGYTISNFYIQDNNSQGRQGLFSYTDGATIKHFNLSGEMTLKYGLKHGSVVAWAINSTIEDISSSVNVTSPTTPGQVGGFAGSVDRTTISRCRYSGTVSSTSAYGKWAGFAGALAGGKLIDCLFDGMLTLSVNNSDLIAGGMTSCSIDYDGNEITNCLMNGTVSISNPTARCGVILGLISKHSFTCSNTYYNSATISDGLRINNPEIEGASSSWTWSMSALPVNPNETGFKWGAIKNSLNSGRTGTDKVWGINESKVTYPVPGEEDHDVTPVATCTIVFKDYDNTTIQSSQVAQGASITKPADPTRQGFTFDGWTTDGTNIVTWPKVATSDLTFTAKYTERSPVNYVNGFNINGQRTDVDYYEAATLGTDDYYIIDNAGKLFWFANQVNAGNGTHSAKVTADIDMDGTNHPEFSGIGYYSSTTADRKKFSGNFDGQGHRIYNCNFTTKTGTLYGGGLIAYASGSNKTIKDFTIEGTINISSSGYGGALGYLDAGYTISGITSSVNITTSASKTGGVVGFVSGKISKCRFNGTLTTTGLAAGGITGGLSKPISDCLFDGKIISTSSNTTVVGGIAATFSAVTIENCLVYGTISTTATSGSIGKVFGKTEYTSGAATLTRVFYGAQGTSTPTVYYNANGQTVNGSVTEVGTTPDWESIKTTLNNGSENWGINSRDYPVPGERDSGYKYTITFDTDGGTEIAPIRQEAGTAVTAPQNPTKTGYTFAGWMNTAGEITSVPTKMPAENITLKAKWTINKYTITFDTDGGSSINPMTLDYGADITKPADPTKDGWVFNGWRPAIPTTMPAENITVVAQWTKDAYSNGFKKIGEKTDEDYYEAPELITSDRCTELGIDSKYVGYYEIKNAGNMFWIAKFISADNNTRKYVVTADIDMEGNVDLHKDWPGIGEWNSSSDAKKFMGTFDGNGHKFTNYYMNITSGSWKGLFCVPKGATIKNFSISGNIDISAGDSQYGVVCGRIAGTTTLDDIHSAVNITVASGKTPRCIGGIVGQCSAITTFNRCRYSGTIDAKSAFSAIGGILGNTEGNPTKLYNCLFDGHISSTSTVVKTTDENGIRIGGLAGGQTGNGKVYIYNSLVAGTISVVEGSEACGTNSHSGIVFGDNSTKGHFSIENTYYRTTGSTSGLRPVGLNNCTESGCIVEPTLITSETTESWDNIMTSLNGTSSPANWTKKTEVYPVPAISSDNSDYIYNTIIFDDASDVPTFPSDAHSIKARRVVYNRDNYMTGGLVSVCLPFAIKLSDLNGTNPQIYIYNRVNGAGNLVLEPVDNVEAGVPCLIYGVESLSISKADNTGIEICTSVVNPTNSDSSSSENNAYGIFGSLKTITIGEGYYKLNKQGNKLIKTTTGSHCYPYRGYLRLPDTAGSTKADFLEFPVSVDNTSDN